MFRRCLPDARRRLARCPPAGRTARAVAHAAGALVLASLALLAGCATFDPPKPWEKGELARPEMQFDADPLDTRTTQHIYTSKEGAYGGYGPGGGGCGCN